MRCKILILAILAVFFTACEDEVDALYKGLETVGLEAQPLSRSGELDSISNGVLIVDSVSQDMLALKEVYNKLFSQRNKAPISSYGNYDEWLSSNMYAIRELPVTIEVRGIANGSTNEYTFLNCTDKGKEVGLAPESSSDDNKFYIKVLPASTGIPYLIYSYKAKTPLTIGHYNKTPNVKILMSQENDNKLSDFAGWDLLASTQNKGYFSIKNNMYIGQADESNPWSIFYYNVEAITKDKLGFAQPVNNKAQQEFLITPCDTFSLSSIEYDLSTATTQKYTESHYGTGQNSSSQYGLVNVNFSFDADETSNFNTWNNSLRVNLDNTTVSLPWVSGESIMLPNTESNRPVINAPFSHVGDYHSHRKIQYTMKQNCPPKHNIQIKAHFVKYNVSVKFKAKAYLDIKDKNGNKTDERLFTITGTWIGTLFEDPNIIEPNKDDPQYTSIGGGSPDIPILRVEDKLLQETKK